MLAASAVHRFWDYVIEPVFEALEPRVILEIGADKGANTAKILAYAQQNAALVHVIDPEPKFDVAAWQKEYGDALRFHRQLSLDAMPSIEATDVVLIDGDHNWYTVFHELKLIERRASESRAPFPVVLMHDVDWPYGRRDLYYDPETIPAQYRHPYETAGMRPGRIELSSAGGLNANLANATAESTVRNGVRTAIEDFLKECKVETRLVTIPGWHGLAILTARSSLETKKTLALLLDRFESADFLIQQCVRIEKSRIRTKLREKDKRRQKEREVRKLREQLAVMDRHAAHETRREESGSVGGY
jgi:hypothetical protein